MIIAQFVPHADITTYELARIVANIMPIDAPIGQRIRFPPAMWEALDPYIKRHFLKIGEEEL